MTFIAFVNEVLTSRIFWAVALTYVFTHFTKFLLHYYKFRKWSIQPFFDTGGMPSSHTATTVALTTAIAFETGASPLLFACGLFSLIIIRDSYGVRKSVSDQAHILNALASEMKVHKKVKIVLGHTPFQVAIGFCVGLLIALALYVF